jgi:FMN phosphatase YigB (HAD superfamily)
MVKNDGSCTNEEAFWNFFTGVYGEKARADMPVFEEFYENEFQQAKQFCGFAPKAREVIRLLHENGVRCVLATNPLFPAVATFSRIRWAGLEPTDFALVTTYENIGCCKPNPAYYSEILRRLCLSPADCLMVGNDVGEDMVAKTLGIDVFLLTDCLINRKNEDISVYPHGNFDDLIAYLKENYL